VSLCAQKNFVRGKNLLSEAAACELQDCQAGASAGEASSKISARRNVADDVAPVAIKAGKDGTQTVV